MGVQRQEQEKKKRNKDKQRTANGKVEVEVEVVLKTRIQPKKEISKKNILKFRGTGGSDTINTS